LARAASTFARAPAALLCTPAAWIVARSCPRETRVPRSTRTPSAVPATCAVTVTRSEGSSDPVRITPVETPPSLACTRSSLERITSGASSSDSAADVSPPQAARMLAADSSRAALARRRLYEGGIYWCRWVYVTVTSGDPVCPGGATRDAFFEDTD